MSWAASAAAMYEVRPDMPGCRTGTIKDGVRAEMLARVNALRALHQLPPVAYSHADNAQVDQSSLMQAINSTLSHRPPRDWLCYTAVGSAGAGSSNLVGGWGNGLDWSTEDDYLGLWLTEGGGSDLGHRRWILDPFLDRIAYGRVAQQFPDGNRSDAASLKVFGSPGNRPADLPPFVAYPFGNYPARYFGPRDYLSFSVVANGGSRFANSAVNFSAVRVSVSQGTRRLAVGNLSYDNEGFGLPNNLQWQVAGLQPNVTYTVRIDGVMAAPQSSYQYSFRIVP